MKRPEAADPDLLAPASAIRGADRIDTTPARTRYALARHGGALCVFAVLSIVWTYPLVFHLGTHIPGGAAGDAATFLWNNWWMRTAFESSTTPLWTPLLFAPYGTSLVLHTHTALPALIGATILGPLPLVLATNLILLAALTMNGFCAYLLGHALTRRYGASLLAGIIYGGSPFVMARLLGHFNLVHAWVLPLCLWCAWRATIARSVAWAGATGLALVAAAYTDYYFTVYAAALVAALAALERLTCYRTPGPASHSKLARTFAIGATVAAGIALAIALTGGTVLEVAGVRVVARRSTNLVTVAWLAGVVALAIRWVPVCRVTWRRLPLPAIGVRHQWASQVLAGLLPLLALAPLVLAAAALWSSGGYVSPTYRWRSSPSGIDVLTLLLGNPRHPITGGWTSAQYTRFGIDGMEGAGWLGVALAVAFLLAREWRQSAAACRLAIAGGAFFILALGPWLMVAGTQTGIVLPGIVLRWVPIVNNARIPGRALLVVYLVIALLVAIGLTRRDARRSRRALPLLIGALVAADYAAVPLPIGRVVVPELYETLAHTPGPVLELPLGFRDGFGEVGRFDEQVLLNQTVHGRPMLGGFVGRLSPAIAASYRANPVVDSLLTASSGQSIPPARAAADAVVAPRAMAALGITTVVLNRTTAPPSLIAYVERVLPRHEPVARDNRREVYSVPR